MALPLFCLLNAFACIGLRQKGQNVHQRVKCWLHVLKETQPISLKFLPVDADRLAALPVAGELLRESRFYR